MLARAGWAVVAVNDEGVLQSAAYGPVPNGIPQTSQSGEHCARIAKDDLVVPHTDYHTDCTVVESYASHGILWATGRDRQHVGI